MSRIQTRSYDSAIGQDSTTSLTYDLLFVQNYSCKIVAGGSLLPYEYLILTNTRSFSKETPSIEIDGRGLRGCYKSVPSHSSFFLNYENEY